MRYEPNLESLQQHTVPAWFENAKLGIFVHWGLFSVPGWAPLTGELSEVAATLGWEALFSRNPYAEWYLNSLRIKGSPTQAYHLQTYGKDFSYDDFVPLFNAAIPQWNPDAWAELFQQTHARYVVLVTKHHDGFLLWQSKRTSPHKKNYYAGRDVVGELAAAVRQRGMRIGLYYSGGLDWSFNATPIQKRADVYDTIVQTPEFVEYVDLHWRELIERYQTSILWNDIGYPLRAPLFELLAHYYNTIPDGVVNDRFGQVTSQDLRDQEEVLRNPDRGHFDFTTPEYSSYHRIVEKKWESTRGIGFSYGYNRAEGVDSYLTAEKAIRLFVDIVSKNGNLLLNVGPMADGTIPELQRRCLSGLGAWLAVNGDAIFDTRPWIESNGETTDDIPVRYTQKRDAVYAILLDTPVGNQVSITALQASDETTIHLVGHSAALRWRQEGSKLTIELPRELNLGQMPAFKITPAPQIHRA